jgi:uncharacterized protein (TIGR00299 family) protein
MAYFDCFSGLAGDMILGALFDVGLDETSFLNQIQKLGLSGYTFEVKQVEENHIAAKDVYITVAEEHQPHRSYKHIKNMIADSSLDDTVKKISQMIFLNLAQAEGRIHNQHFEDVHFHEVGAVDSIIDIVGAVIGIQKLGITHIICSPLPLGKGFVKCAHGMIPIPAPATVELLKNVPVYQTDRIQELVTPTGAAIITTISERFGDMPSMKIKKIGYGSGKTKSTYPSLLRIIIGEEEEM